MAASIHFMAPQAPRGQVLAPGGQAVQDRPTFPAGTQPRWNPPFFLLFQLGCESRKVPLTFFLSPPPQATGHEQA